MSLVTVLWSMGAGAAVMLAVLYGATWVLDRRLLAYFFLGVISIATAGIARCEIGMMHAGTPAEFGEWTRWYHLPVFFQMVGQMLFVACYLGAGRMWLAWAAVGMRTVLLTVNFLVHPSVFFRDLYSLGRVSFLGDTVAVVGDAVLRPWLWVARLSLLVAIVFVIDACVQRWRRGDAESKHKVWIVLAAVLAPGVISIAMTQIAILGASTPYLDTPASLLTLTVMAFELSRDVTVSGRTRVELAQVRDNLFQVGRVGIMGQLASTLAHELTQPLGAILRNAEAAELHLQTPAPDLEELRSIVADIRKDDRRAGEIIERMRSLIKRHKVERRRVVLDDVVQDVISLTHSEAASKQVTVKYAAEPALPPLSGDRVHISQVLLNLIVNSLEAVQSRPVDNRRVVIEARTYLGQVEITVRDSGPGIPTADVSRIFDPLFTTKSHGLGMGLAICRTLVEAQDGRLWAEHNPHADGAVFRFVLPRAEESAP
jgi:signal transduction histidine kinase